MILILKLCINFLWLRKVNKGENHLKQLREDLRRKIEQNEEKTRFTKHFFIIPNLQLHFAKKKQLFLIFIISVQINQKMDFYTNY
jgi:hypothetical protein